MIQFVSVYDDERHVLELYQLLEERPPEANISHQEMPSLQEHAKFVQSRPYAIWLMVKAKPQPPRQQDTPFGPIEFEWPSVGAIYATSKNEIGVFIFKRFQRRGFATMAIEKFITELKPLPAVGGIRRGQWLANIAPENEASKALFRKLGFSKIQETFAL